MKRFILTLTLVFLSCVMVFANNYAIPIMGSGSYNLLGSQFSATETVTSYSTFPIITDQVLFWDVALQDFAPTQPTYNQGGWSANPPIPLGMGFFYINQGATTTFNRNIDPNLLPPLTPVDLTSTPNLWHALSSQRPATATYGDLVGSPGATPMSHTFVMHWDPSLADFDTIWRFTPSLTGWRKYNNGVVTFAAPLIPQFEGAFVAWFNAAACSPAPLLTSVQVSGCCAPDVELTLTFSSGVDPISAALLYNYSVSPGTVTGVTVQRTPATSLIPVVLSVVLNVKLMTQCPNTYSVNANGVTCLGGTPVTGTLPFSLTGCGAAPVNDTPATASPLSSGTTVFGSLKLADCTPSSAVSQFPTGAGASAKDVWYTYTPLPGAAYTATINTCYALPSGCAQSDLMIAVYLMSGGMLNPIPGTYSSSSWSCSSSVNPNAVGLSFGSNPCETYFIRVSGKDSGLLPGDFAMQLTAPNAAPPNDACLSAISVGPNSSTPFDTFAATTDGPSSEAVYKDVWYRFQWPAGPGGPYATVVETCNSSFSTAFAVYAVGGPCPGTLVPLSAAASGAGCAGANSFLATAGQQYLIRVGGAAVGGAGCGRLHLTSGIPSAGTGPAVGNLACKKYRISGLPTGVGWTWNLTATAGAGCLGFNVTDTVAPYAPTPLTAARLATEFATSIATHPGFTTVVTAINSGVADLQICFPCPASQVALYVDGCLVTSGAPCSFNPDITDLDASGNPDLDCNGNGQSDYLDILQGTSSDTDGNGVPDECQGCVQVAIAGGPVSTSAGVGGDATFIARVVGTGPFSYQWRKAGVPLLGQTNATLMLTNLPLDAAGLYEVVVTNTCGSDTSPSAVLIVSPQPVLNIANAGTNVVLSWNTGEYFLQKNPVLDNPAGWIDITNASPVTIPFTNAASYFRLRLYQ